MGETTLKKPLMALVAVVLLVGGVIFVGTFTLGLGENVQETATRSPVAVQQSNELGVESGSLFVESNDAQDDARELKGVLDEYGGEVERETMEVRTGSITHQLEVLVERSRSVEFVDQVQEDYEVTRADVVYATQTDGDTGSEGSVKMSSVEVTFHEEREPQLLPDDFTDVVRAEVGGSLESLSDNAAKLVALPFAVISILLVILRIATYIAAVVLPLVVGYAVVQRFLKLDLAEG
jgi:hypothetical protein